MSDIVERLRDRDFEDYNEICDTAADEIERLRAENATARQAADDVYSRLMPEVELLREQLAFERGKLSKTEYLFDRKWDADMRAIKRWQEAHPGNDLVWPDRADMVVWLMERHSEAERSTLHHIELRDAQRRRAERAEAQVAALREALALFTCDCAPKIECADPSYCRNSIARAALEEK